MSNWLFLLCLVLTGCGFTPVYQQSDGAVAQKLAAIDVAPIALKDKTQARAGQLLKQYLEAELNPRNVTIPKTHRLDVTLKTMTAPLIVVRTKEVERYNARLHGNFELVNKKNQKAHRDDSTIISSYNAAVSDYATYSSEQDTILRGVKEMARDIRIKLTTHLMNK